MGFRPFGAFGKCKKAVAPPTGPQVAPKTLSGAPIAPSRGAQEASKTLPNPPKIYTYVENLENQKNT